MSCFSGKIHGHFVVQAGFFQDWLPLELTHPNFRVKKFSHACQLSYETSTIPIGQVVQVQDFFKWKNTIKSCIVLGVKILKKMVHIQRNLGELYRGRTAMGLKYVVAGLSVMAKSDVSARNSLHITPSVYSLSHPTQHCECTLSFLPTQHYEEGESVNWVVICIWPPKIILHSDYYYLDALGCRMHK